MAHPKLHPDSRSFELVNQREQIDAAEHELINALERHSFPEAARFAVRLALEEALVNAFKHGHRALPAQTPVSVRYCVNDQEVQIDVIDQGPGFKPEDVPDPTVEENLEKSSGRGLLLMRAYMTDLQHLGSGNHLRMTFRRSPRP